MCIIERKTYLLFDGRQEIVETTRRCPRAVGSHLCRHIDRRTSQPQVVETRPSSGRPSIDSTPSDGVIITEGFNGRQRIYRDLSKRSSNSSSIRRSTTMSDRSPISTPSSASSPSYVEVKPSAPTPPPAAAGFPFPERTRAPYPPVLPPAPGRIITEAGTAVYDHPPSLELPRAFDNERPSSTGRERRASVSSTRAEVDEPSSSRPRRRPSIKIDTGIRPPTTSSSPSVDSPRLSDLPRVSSLRRDSGKEVPRRDSRKADRQRSYSDRQRRTERDSRRQDEDDRQARLERERLGESDRRQSAREALARAASRERHRQAAAAALEGQQRDDDPIQQARDAELAQMARERADAARRHESDNTPRYVDDQLRRDADRARYQATRNSPVNYSPRRLTGETFTPASPPISARSPIPARSSLYQPIVHQYPSARRNSNTFRERGDDVIAREQARGAAAATERLTNALGRMSVEEPYDDDGYDLVDDYYVDESEEQRRRRRAEERERHQRFYR